MTSVARLVTEGTHTPPAFFSILAIPPFSGSTIMVGDRKMTVAVDTIHPKKRSTIETLNYQYHKIVYVLNVLCLMQTVEYVFILFYRINNNKNI